MSAAATLLTLFRVPFTTEAKRLSRLEGVQRHRLDRTGPSVPVFAMCGASLPTRSPFVRLTLPQGCDLVKASALRGA